MPVDREKPATVGLLFTIVERIGRSMRKVIDARIDAAVAPIATRVGALSMLLARGDKAQADLRGLEELIERVKSQERRIAELEAWPSVTYRGVWNADTQFNPGDLTTHGGSVFHCNKSTRARPGDSSDWTLAVKRGRDGKDAS